MSLHNADELRILRDRVLRLEEELESRIRDEGSNTGVLAVGLYKHSASTSSMKVARFTPPVVPGDPVTVEVLNKIVAVNFLNMPPSPTIATGSTLVGVECGGILCGLWYGRP